MRQVLLNTEANHQISGNLLEERYQILQDLRNSSCGRKYIAEDTLSPGNPKCVIKHIKLISNEPNFWQTAKQQFISKSHSLKTLGERDGIPKVLNYFENDRGFYLVQEFIEGQPLSELLPSSQRCGKRWKQCQIVRFLQEILSILEFIHSQGFIHCDIKPNNIIKRASDDKFCLIGFGALQSVQAPSVNSPKKVVFPLSPAGYIPAEQLAYQPQPNSDIFALGAIAIQALSGLHPAQLQANPHARKWHEQLGVNHILISILNEMVSYQYQERYQSATEALQAIGSLIASIQESQVCSEHLQSTANQSEIVASNTDNISQEVSDSSPIPTNDVAAELPTSENSEVGDRSLGTVDSNSSSDSPEVESETVASVPEETTDTSLNPILKDGEEIVDLIENSSSESSLESLVLVTPETEFFETSDKPEVKEESPEASTNCLKKKLVSKFRKTPAMVAAFGIGMAANALVMAAGLFYISQPDPTKFKQVDALINQVQLEEGAKQICQIPKICFWQNNDEQNVQSEKAKTTAEVQQKMQQAFRYAAQKDFSSALKYLDEISPQATDYAKVKAKIAEYRQKQRIKEKAEKITKLGPRN